MSGAFLRLGLITAATMIVVVFAVVFIRTLGQQQVFAEPPHPWFEQTYWNVYAPKDICSHFEQPALTTLVLTETHFQDGEWFTACGTLDQLLKSSAHPHWILKVKANDATNLDKLVETVERFDAKKKFAFVSDSQRASRFLRKRGPQWLYAADPASLVRMQMFASLWIETAMDFWPDFVFASADPHSPSFLSERLAREFERRHKRIVWKGNEAPLIPVQGRVSDHP